MKIPTSPLLLTLPFLGSTLAAPLPSSHPNSPKVDDYERSPQLGGGSPRLDAGAGAGWKVDKKDWGLGVREGGRHGVMARRLGRRQLPVPPLSTDQHGLTAQVATPPGQIQDVQDMASGSGGTAVQSATAGLQGLLGSGSGLPLAGSSGSLPLVGQLPGGVVNLVGGGLPLAGNLVGQLGSNLPLVGQVAGMASTLPTSVTSQLGGSAGLSSLPRVGQLGGLTGMASSLPMVGQLGGTAGDLVGPLGGAASNLPLMGQVAGAASSLPLVGQVGSLANTGAQSGLPLVGQLGSAASGLPLVGQLGGAASNLSLVGQLAGAASNLPSSVSQVANNGGGPLPPVSQLSSAASDATSITGQLPTSADMQRSPSLPLQPLLAPSAQTRWINIAGQVYPVNAMGQILGLPRGLLPLNFAASSDIDPAAASGDTNMNPMETFEADATSSAPTDLLATTTMDGSMPSASVSASASWSDAYLPPTPTLSSAITAAPTASSLYPADEATWSAMPMPSASGDALDMIAGGVMGGGEKSLFPGEFQEWQDALRSAAAGTMTLGSMPTPMPTTTDEMDGSTDWLISASASLPSGAVQTGGVSMSL